MPNTYFQFKQFLIDQAVDGMKVTTDGCIFGALIKEVSKGNILDIGTGTGLLSLMLAQRTKAEIHALEIDENVAQQAVENVKNSPWQDQIIVLQQDFKVFETETIYDQIICNPPFFKNSHKGQSASKNTAIHDDDLPMVTLINRSEKLLSSQGSLWVMYPEYEMKQFTLLASESGFSLCQQTAIYNQADKPVFRVVAQFSKAQPNKSISLELIIKEADGSYTKKFTHLLKEYYLHL